MRAAAILLLALLLLLPAAAGAAERAPFAIGYLEIAGDPRYVPVRNYTGLKLKTVKRPFSGAEAALRESRVVARALGLTLGLERAEAATPATLAAAARTMRDAAGIRVFLVDADADALLALADALRDDRVLLFNISETADRLRRADCRANLMHVIPSQAMLGDAMAQYLALANWRRVLVLRGELPADAVLADAFARSARKFGLKIVATKDFVLSNDPRERGRNNVRLLTAEPAHDVVFLADSHGEFGRYVPYQTHRPRPVVGSEGLVAAAWHWAWERHGAPQLNQRFEKQAGREMRDADWAAWAAVRLIVEALIRTGSTEFDALAAYLKGDALTFDAYKGNPASFRPWNNQLRQPVLLHTHNAVAARAPLDGFLHRTDILDTLGIDEPESSCRF
ncbi:MAG: ABC transporter substrate-binding protein [Alphaproteobacteria bacterium]|nr:ABC transporter substrate-binding protein [Alphaproteobacteria bacterium]